MLDEDVSRLIADIYAGADDRRTWDRAMEAVAERLGLFLMNAVVDTQGRIPVSTDFYRISESRFADTIREYHEERYKDDPTIPHAVRHGTGMFDSVRHIVTDDYARHDYIRWSAAHVGSHYWTTFYTGWGRDLAFGAALHRTAKDGPLRGRELALFRMLFGHMDNAIRLVAHRPMAETGEPLFLLDGLGGLIRANDAGRRLLESGAALTLVDGRLRAAGRAASDGLDRAIRSALSVRETGGAGGSAVLAREDGPPLFAKVTPLPGGDGPLAALRPAAMVRLVDPAAVPTDRRVDWKALFGFTAAETRLADALLVGDGNLRHAAERLGIAYATARAQLASLFDKAEVRNQTQLVRLLTRLG